MAALSFRWWWWRLKAWSIDVFVLVVSRSWSPFFRQFCQFLCQLFPFLSFPALFFDPFATSFVSLMSAQRAPSSLCHWARRHLHNWRVAIARDLTALLVFPAISDGRRCTVATLVPSAEASLQLRLFLTPPGLGWTSLSLCFSFLLLLLQLLLPEYCVPLR